MAEVVEKKGTDEVQEEVTGPTRMSPGQRVGGLDRGEGPGKIGKKCNPWG